MIGVADRPDGVWVGRLTLRGPGLDAGVARMRAEHVLGAADLRPAGLPPHAILLVRRMVDPAPRRLSLDPGTHAPSGEWESVLRSRLADLYRGAGRPARGSVASDADAVVFADEAELLAACAIDVLDGRAADAWWWRTVFGARAPSAGSLAVALASAPAAVPALLEGLDRRGRADELLRRIDEPATWRILRAVADAFGVGALAAELADGAAPSPSSIGTSARPEDRGRGAVSPGDPRWPETAGGLGATGPLPWHAYALLELSLALRHNPASVSGSSFAREVRTSYPAVAGAARESRTPGPRTGGDAPSGPVVDNAGIEAPANPAARANIGTSDGGAPRPPRFRRSDTAPARRDPGASVEASAERTVVDERPVADIAAVLPDGRAIDRASSPEASDASVPGLEPASVRTELAGVFYLVNVMTWLDLPDAFEADWRLASACGAWGTLELLARGLVGRGRRYGDDGLWQALAGLGAHRDGHAAGDALVRPRIAVVPVGWSFVDGSARLSLRQLRPTGLCRDLSPAARSWLGLVLPHVRLLLGDALGAPDGREAIVDMLARPGRVRVSATHVDVEMGLKDISVPVRRAGLDRDPGWQPAFGRTIRLHYE
jgi:hypothetical protein